MLSSSRITKAKRGSAISSCALPQARSAAAMSRLMSCVSQVKPSPIVCQETRSPNVCSASRSAERGGRFPLAGARVHDQQALLDRLAGYFSVLHGLALGHLGAMALGLGLIDCAHPDLL